MGSFCAFLIFFLSLCSLFSQATPDCPQIVRLACQQKEACGECMSVHPCCNWCYDESFDGRRCDFQAVLNNTCTNIIENQISSVHIILEKDFIDIHDADDATAAVQVKPQKFKVILRGGQSVNISFTYKAAENYPLELYYLGDLSYSMMPHLETLKNLGEGLGKHLAMLTKHYKLAFGSFLDKPGMPFILTNKIHFNNPCHASDYLVPCGKTYLFRHSLNFTNNINAFFQKVKESEISANVDDLDGGLEAIFQVLVCRQFGWSENSRKIIVLSTDSYLHTAGDGLLVGATKVNEGVCLVDSDGNHMDPLKYDYPSVDVIRRLLREYKTNLIVAVTEDKKPSYDQMEEQLLKQESFVGTLSENSTNILDLVSKGYYDFIRQVEFSANSSHVPELQLDFFSKCDDNGYKKTAGCGNVEEGKPIQFKLQLTLNKAPENETEDVIHIREKSINDNIEVQIEYVGGICKCPGMVEMASSQCVVHGVQDCDRCSCKPGWKGDVCSQECDGNIDKCLMNNEFGICSGQGECICGTCSCKPPYEGEFCQYQCPVYDEKKCAGNGYCTFGACTCSSGFTGTDCSCSENTDKCRIQMTDSLCGKNGECKCNKCICNEGYSGKFCEWRNSTVNDICNMLDAHVQQYCIEKKNKITKDNITVMVEKGQGLPEAGICDDCSFVTYLNSTERCAVQYCYGKGNLQEDYIHVTVRQKCVYTAQAMGIGLAGGAFLAVLLGGLLIIGIQKFQIYRADKAEFDKFKKDLEYKNQEEENPLYLSPITNFTNPVHESNTRNLAM